MLLGAHIVYAQSVTDLVLEDPEDIELLEEFKKTEKSDEKAPGESKKDVEQGDDLEQLKTDLGGIEEFDFFLPEDVESELKEAQKVEQATKKDSSKIKIIKDGEVKSKEAAMIFDVGKAEKDLLAIAKTMQGKIPDNEWNEIAGKSASGTYEVQSGDWLWKISKQIFGSGFYYSKIWSLNPYITNPHLIEPGMILSFSTGSDNAVPNISVVNQKIAKKAKAQKNTKFDKFGDNAKPQWLIEREKLQKQGVYIQYSSSDTQEDLMKIGEASIIKEYEVYEPPRFDFEIAAPETEYDSTGFDKNARIIYNFKEGFSIYTFISSNVVQDLGKVHSAIEEKSIFSEHDKLFVKFDEGINVVSGDKFSVYVSGGEIEHKNSDRKGYKYTVKGSLETIQKVNGLWECKLIETSGYVSRGDRITIYTPNIERITRTYNSRIIEAVLVASYKDRLENASFGDVIYLDRGRADGVELGNVFEVYGFKDRATGRNISGNPSYKNGEITVINVTDNFSTGLVSHSLRDFQIGDIAVTKSKEAAARVTKIKNKIMSEDAKRMSDQALDELDVELNLDDLNDALLDKADQIQFTEDELAELERQEREKSIISENEQDLKALERLESELETAEKMMNEAKLDEDKLLEEEDLNKVENKFGVAQQESLDEIEENFGQRFLDEELNDKENPYGLTEFDIEEIDELLNSDQE